MAEIILQCGFGLNYKGEAHAQRFTAGRKLTDELV